jgi:hypothetical protein
MGAAMKHRRAILSIVAALVVAVPVGVTFESAAAAAPVPYICTGGTFLPAGTYSSLIVTGYCPFITSVVVKGSVTVTSGGLLLDFAGNGSLVVDGGVFVNSGSVFLHHARINGGVRGNESGDQMSIGQSTISGGISLQNDVITPTFVGIGVAVIDDHVMGGIRVENVNSPYEGVIIYSQVMGGVRVENYISDFPLLIAANVIHGSMSCDGNNPAPATFLFNPPNVVTGQLLGQCVGF